MKTEWKIIAECPRYEVSSSGKVRNIISKYEMKLHANSRPRCRSEQVRVFLYDGKKMLARMVSRLVANAFLPNPDNLPFVEHVNGKYTDNRACNLRWAKMAEIMQNPVILRRINKNHPRTKRKK